MNLYGWIFMAIGWGFVILLASFCFYRIFSKRAKANDEERK